MRMWTLAACVSLHWPGRELRNQFWNRLMQVVSLELKRQSRPPPARHRKPRCQMSGPGSLAGPCPVVTQGETFRFEWTPSTWRGIPFFVTYNYLESVEKWRSVGQTAELKVGGVVFRDVPISAGTQEHFLYVTDEGVAQILHRIHHYSSVNRIPWGKRSTVFNNVKHTTWKVYYVHWLRFVKLFYFALTTKAWKNMSKTFKRLFQKIKLRLS